MDVGNRVPIWHGGTVEGTVVTAWPPVPGSLLGHHMEGGHS